MRLFIEDPTTRERVYLRETAKSRKELRRMIGADRFTVNNRTYSIKAVKATPRETTPFALALGGVVGVMGGVPGVLIGSVIGGLVGKSSDDEDRKLAEDFNKSNM